MKGSQVASGVLTMERRATHADVALITQRRAFNAGVAAFEEWYKAHQRPGIQEVWQAFNEYIGPPFRLQSDGLWRWGVHPSRRQFIASAFCNFARTKMEIDPMVDPRLDDIETRLWSAALSVSPRTVAAWEERQLKRHGEIGFGFVSVKHRLATLLLQATRSDERAVRLYIEVFTGSRAVSAPTHGAVPLAALLERGASISPSMPANEIAHRYSLCLLLWNRGWKADWVKTALANALSNS